MFSRLDPIVQLVAIGGTFATIFLIAFSRTAAMNLVAFLRGLYNIYRQGKCINLTISQDEPTSSHKVIVQQNMDQAGQSVEINQ